MPTVAFDTLKAAQRLGQAGFTEDQAGALVTTFADGITENLATKADIKALDTKIDAVAEALTKDMKALDTKIDAVAEALQKDMTALDIKIDAVAESLQKDMKALGKDMTIRLGGLMVGGLVLLTLLDRVFAS